MRPKTHQYWPLAGLLRVWPCISIHTGTNQRIPLEVEGFQDDLAVVAQEFGVAQDPAHSSSPEKVRRGVTGGHLALFLLEDDVAVGPDSVIDVPRHCLRHWLLHLKLK